VWLQISGEVVNLTRSFFCGSSENVILKELLKLVHISQIIVKTKRVHLYGPECRPTLCYKASICEAVIMG